MGVFIQERWGGEGFQPGLYRCASQNKLTENDTVFFILHRENILHLASLGGAGGETLQSMLFHSKSGRQHLILPGERREK